MDWLPNDTAPWPAIRAPLPDEVLYSWIGRLIRRNAISPWACAVRQILGGNGPGLTIDLPSGIGSLHRAFGQAAGFASVEEWIERTTLYPFHRPFIDPERHGRIMLRMLSDPSDAAGLKTLIGRVANGFGASVSLRYCRSCALNDLETFDEAYWRRAWLLPNASHCLLHDEPLFIQRQNIRAANPYEAVPIELRDRLSERHDHQYVATLAHTRLAVGTLNGQIPPLDPALLSQLYRDKARAHGYLTRGGSYRLAKMTRDICASNENFAGFEAQERLSRSSGIHLPWLTSILSRPGRAIHPSCHLILIGHLWGSIDAFRRSLDEGAPDNDVRPEPEIVRRREVEWAVVRDAALTCRAAAEQVGLSTGTVVALRHEVGMHVKSRRHARVLAAEGGVVASLVKGDALSKVASDNGVSLATVCRCLRRSPAVKLAREQVILRNRHLAARESWNCALDESATVTRARALAPAAFAWLRRNDAQWLRESVKRLAPKVNVPDSRARRVDWVVRDEQLSARICAFSPAGIDDEAGRRTSPYGLLRELGVQAMVVRNWMRLPKTFDAMMSRTESVIEWQERRLAVASKEFSAQGIPFTLSKLMRKARVNSSHVEIARSWLAKQSDLVGTVGAS